MTRSRYGSGGFTGWSEFRYGPVRKVKLVSVLGAGRHEHAVSSTTEMLGRFRSTPFELEAPCRHGIRQELCLAGNGWSAADDTAALIVRDALSRIGAKRPTWEQGQREYAELDGKCHWCGQEMEDGGRRRYCSDTCAKMALEHRAEDVRAKDDTLRQHAHDLLRRYSTKERKCVHCGEGFHPQKESSDQVFCSVRCRVDYAAAVAQYPRVCCYCGEFFMAHSPTAELCSGACKSAAHRLRKGVLPRGLSVRTFDHYVALPVNSSQPLTAPRLDTLLAA